LLLLVLRDHCFDGREFAFIRFFFRNEAHCEGRLTILEKRLHDISDRTARRIFLRERGIVDVSATLEFALHRTLLLENAQHREHCRICKRRWRHRGSDIRHGAATKLPEHLHDSKLAFG
jgi:hypothetical protein